VEQVDVVIIGAGVVGLAIAQEVSHRFPDLDVVLFERHRRFGQETSSRNSEVIHSGLYYPADSLKTKLCIGGNRMLYRFCEEHGVNHSRIGKLIVASNESDLAVLEQLYRQGTENGVRLEPLDAGTIRRMEPNIVAKAGLLSIDTGIVDTEGLMRCMYRLAADRGVLMVFESPVVHIEPAQGGYVVRNHNDEWFSRYVVNSAGLASELDAAMVGPDVDGFGYRLHYCKGEYYQLSPRIRVDRLVYPPPEHAGLGIHITKDLSGGQRLGPNAYYVNEINYDMDESHREEFFAAASAYIAGLRPDDIQPDFAGIRPKLQGPDDGFKDFVLAEESDKGLPGFINLIGIESPGLTACLAIADRVCRFVRLQND